MLVDDQWLPVNISLLHALGKTSRLMDMKSIGKIRRFWIGVAGACCFVCLFAHMAGGAPVTSREVREMVVGWQQLSPNPLRTSVGKQISSIRCITNAVGDELYFVVQLLPDGFVLTAADTRIEPILAFSGSGSFVPDPQNPLVCLIRQDAQARLAVLPPDAGSRGGGSVQTKKWKRLQDAAQHPVRGLEAVDELRVSPLLVDRSINIFTYNTLSAMIASNLIRRRSWHEKHNGHHWSSPMKAGKYLQCFLVQ